MQLLRMLPPAAVLGIASGICWYLFWSEPEPDKWPRRNKIPQVRVERLKPVDYQVRLKSQGTVQARTESTLIAEVRGRVTSISPSFRAGGFFEEREVLLEIDPRDYEAEVKVAEAIVTQAELSLSEEEARAEQARRDWKRLQFAEEASDLVLRIPQLKHARANVESSEARLESARLNLERTRIAAPYAGCILSKNVDIGQYLSTGNVLARIYAVDYAEIRLPLNERQLAYLRIPDSYRGESSLSSEGPEVTLVSSVGPETYRWFGRVVRAEGTLDTRSRQLFVVAQVDDPYGKKADGRPPLKVGSFVQATIKGRVLENVILLPRKHYRKNEYVLIIDDNDKLRRRTIEVEWSDEENLVVRSGLEGGDRLCLTHLSFPVAGISVAVVSEDGKPVDGAQDKQAPPMDLRNLMANIDMARLPDDLKRQLQEARAKKDFPKLRELSSELQKYQKEGS